MTSVNGQPYENSTAEAAEESDSISYAEGDTPTEDYTNIPDVLLLNHLCANATAKKPETWEQVRHWLRTHEAEEVRQAAEQRGESAMTPLHFACRNAPPSDVIDVFLSIAVDTVQWPDAFGWLPIHYACACSASIDVVQRLAEEFPESKTTLDRRGRTPLHFALGNPSDKPDSPAMVALLSSSGASSYADDNGMLPLHYACAYGASEEALYVLTEAYPEGLTTKDRRLRTPLHFSLSNAGRKASPSAVRLLLSLNKDVVNNRDGGILPLRVLAEFSRTVTNQKEVHPNVRKCLEHLLAADPDPTPDFFTALQSLPHWLEERAVVMPNVQRLLNAKISQRFPTMILLLDFYFILLIIVFYALTVTKSIDHRSTCYSAGNCDKETRRIEWNLIIPLYLGAFYLFCREVIQVISLLSLKSITVWLKDGSNWINIVNVIVIVFWAVIMQCGVIENIWAFRTGTALSVVFFWVKLLAFMRQLFIDFAVFISALFYVVRRLVAFMLALIICLVGFAQTFWTIFRKSDHCENYQKQLFSNDKTNFCLNDQESRPYCGSFWDAYISVYTMLLGEVNEELFETSVYATVLFCLFMFLMVILLANVLIAIVTDSYKVIQDTRANIVFWTNRLDFVAEMDAISNGPWKKHLKDILGMNTEETATNDSRKIATLGSDFWRRLMDLFADDVETSSFFFLEFWCFTTLRIVTAIFLIPGWILLGLLSAGWLWPPQIREALLTSTITKHDVAAIEDEKRKKAVENLKQEVKGFKDEFMRELAVDRAQLVQMRSAVASRKTEMSNEMKHIKRIMTMLFEQQANA